ncbi:ParB/RepB/Spo0J family partition protein [Patescibacteria group bacterium]|nr:ParB/RepB/Spo0J family partition protein [Patescibacteria group bacterium]
MPALGKGLGSLIPSKNKKVLVEDLGEEIDVKSIEEVPVDQIVANPWQPRTHFDSDNLNELAESIKQHGFLQPLIVSKEGNNYQLIAGERRLRASQILGLTHVPVIVRQVSDRDKLELSIVENIQRRDLNPLETANSYKRLMEEFGLTVEEVAEQLGKGVSTVNNFLRLLKLPILIKEALAKGEITFSHAKLILSRQSKEEQIKLFKEIKKHDLTVSQLEEINKKESLKYKKDKPRDPVLASWEDKLTKNIGAKVSINKHGERGFVKINFHSHAELKNIFDKLES